MDAKQKKMKCPREENLLTLRKDAINKALINKRISSFLNRTQKEKDLEIDVALLNIPQKLLTAFNQAGNNEKIMIAYQQMKSTTPNYMMYGMKQIRFFSDTLTEKNTIDNTSIINQEIFDYIFTNMLSIENLNIVYEACCTIINITHYSEYYSKQLSQENYINILINLLNKYSHHMIINTQLMIIIGNIIEISRESFLTILLPKFPYFKYITDLLKKIIGGSTKDEFPLSTIEIILWNIGLYVKYIPNDQVRDIMGILIDIIPLIMKLSTNKINKEIFKAALDALYWIVAIGTRDNDIDKTIINTINDIDDIYSKLTNMIDYAHSETCKLILSIYLDITYVSNQSMTLMTEDDLFYDSIEKVLKCFMEDEITQRQKKNKVDVIIMTYKLLNNFATSTIRRNNVIMRETNIMKYTMNIVEDQSLNKELLIEIVGFLANSFEKTDKRIKAEFIRFPIPELVIGKLTSEYGMNELVENCLKILEMILSYGETILPGRNVLKEHCDLLNLPEILSNLYTKLSPNNEKSIILIELIKKKYYNE